MELYVKENKKKRADFLLNHHDMVDLYIQVEIVTKTFVVKLFLNFDANIRTVTAVSGNCFDVTLFRVADKVLFSDVFGFGHTEANDILQPSKLVSSFLRTPTSPVKVCNPTFLGIW